MDMDHFSLSPFSPWSKSSGLHQPFLPTTASPLLQHNHATTSQAILQPPSPTPFRQSSVPIDGIPQPEALTELHPLASDSSATQNNAPKSPFGLSATKDSTITLSPGTGKDSNVHVEPIITRSGRPVVQPAHSDFSFDNFGLGISSEAWTFPSDDEDDLDYTLPVSQQASGDVSLSVPTSVDHNGPNQGHCTEQSSDLSTVDHLHAGSSLSSAKTSLQHSSDTSLRMSHKSLPALKPETTAEALRDLLLGHHFAHSQSLLHGISDVRPPRAISTGLDSSASKGSTLPVSSSEPTLKRKRRNVPLSEEELQRKVEHRREIQRGSAAAVRKKKKDQALFLELRCNELENENVLLLEKLKRLEASAAEDRASSQRHIQALLQNRNELLQKLQVHAAAETPPKQPQLSDAIPALRMLLMTLENHSVASAHAPGGYVSLNPSPRDTCSESTHGTSECSDADSASYSGASSGNEP